MNHLDTNLIASLANRLDESRVQARETKRLTEETPDLSLSDAYLIQDAGIRFRLSQGERIIGYKMGLTSKAKRDQMGLHQPIYGVLTDRMQIQGEYRLAGRIHPKIEPEIAFFMDHEMRGRPSREEILTNCRAIAPALEILDSRYVGFKYFSLPDVVADNSSSSDFVVGEPIPTARLAQALGAASVTNLDLNAIELKMVVNGTMAQSAPASAISGDPVLSVIQLCELLDSRGFSLPAGSIVLAGAATQAVQLEPGMRVELQAGTLGSLSVAIGQA